MSSSWWIGIVTKAPIEEKKVDNFVKVLFDLCDDIIFTPVIKSLSYYGGSKEETAELEFTEKPSPSKLAEFIKKYVNKECYINFNFNRSVGKGGFDGSVEIYNKGGVVDIWFHFDDYIAWDRENVGKTNQENIEKILEICDAVYHATDAFYAYLSGEGDPEMEFRKRSEFIEVFERYKKEGARITTCTLS